MRYFLIIVSIIGSLFQSFAQSKAKYNSLFWEITGKGLSKPSYLYGTMHVSNKVAFHLNDTFFMALQNVDEVALETNPEFWMKEMYETEKNDITISKSQPASSNLYRAGFYLNIPQKKDLKSVLRYYPNVVNSLLYRKQEGNDNFEENTYLDLFILQAGKKLGKKVTSLEDYKYSQKLVDLAYESLDESDEEKLSYAKRTKILKGTSYNELIEDAYRRGDLDMIDSLSRLFTASKNYHKYMLDVRNEIMVKGMDSIMKLHPLFTGVGAAHLPGEMGVINLLRKKGYTIRPISIASDLVSKRKEEIEKMSVPITFKPFTDEDSTFSVDVPGKMYDVAKFKSHRYYLYPDMVNGCFYMVMVVQTYNALLGIKPNDYQKRIDSLLFENIPGKILKKTPIIQNGFSGIELENVTKRGDYQKYRIIIMPQQLVVVRVNGNGEYVKGKEIDKFFSSFKLREPIKKGFVTATLNLGNAKALMPTKFHTEGTKTYNYSLVTANILNGIDENNKQYVLAKAAYSDFKYLEEDTFELNSFVQTFCKEQDFKLKSSKLSLQKNSSKIDFVATHNNNEFYGKITLNQPFYYLQLTNAKDKNATQFFNSLQVNLPYSETQRFEKYTDSSLFFNVSTYKFNNLEKEKLAAYKFKKLSAAKAENEAARNSYARTHYYYNKETNECAEISFIRFSKYLSFANPDTFWTRRFDRYTSNKSLIIKSKKQYLRNGLQEGFATYTDTNTNQQINVRIIIKNEALYVIKTNSDTISGSEFTKKLLKTLAPTDTVFGTSLFASKANLFFTDLYSKDKPTYLMAREALSNNEVEFLSQDDSLLLINIQKKEFDALPPKYKKILLKELSWCKKKYIPEAVKKLYDKYADSTEIQIALLQALSRHKTKEATNVLADILFNDTPALSSNEESMDILYPYFDTLQLAKQLFPKLLDLTRYFEYKYTVHKLLAYGFYNNVFNADSFAFYKPILFKEYKDEIKRQYGNTQDLTEDSDNKEDTKEKPLERSVFVYSNNNSESQFGNDYLYALTIIAEAYNKDPQFTNFLEKIYKLKPSITKATILSYLLNKNYKVNDTVIKALCNNNSIMPYFYKRLIKYSKETFFHIAKLNQSSFSKAIAFMKSKSEANGDSLVFMDKRKVNIKNTPGTIYFYKLRDKDSKFSIYNGGVFPIDEKQIYPYKAVTTDYKSVSKGDNEKEILDELIESLRNKGRKRVQSNSYYDY